MDHKAYFEELVKKKLGLKHKIPASFTEAKTLGTMTSCKFKAY